jgi:hypothetical protein
MSKHVLAALAAMSLTFGCSHSHTYSTQEGSVSVADGKDGAQSIHAVGKDGSSIDIQKGKKITDYPGDVPLYEATSVMDIKAGQKNARSVMLKSSDSIDKISGFYKTQLESKGWKVETSMNMDKMVMYKASKDNRDLVVQIGSDSDGSSISQTLGDK